MRPSTLSFIRAALCLGFLVFAECCGVPEYSGTPPGSCEVPTIPNDFHDCAAGETETLRMDEWACPGSDSAEKYSLVRQNYIGGGVVKLLRNNVTLIAASGPSVPVCWTQRNVDAIPASCKKFGSWGRCNKPAEAPRRSSY